MTFLLITMVIVMMNDFNTPIEMNPPPSQLHSIKYHHHN